MIEDVRKFLAEKKPEIVAAGLTISVAGSAVASQAFGADATSDTINSTFAILGGMMDSFATLVPHFINLIVAFIPLAILGGIDTMKLELDQDPKIRAIQKRILKYLAAFVILASAIYLIGMYNMIVYGNAVPIGWVNGNSMLPAYHSGQMFYYYTPDKKSIENGTVILYTKALTKAPVIHRIVAIEPDGSFITKGDNNVDTDQELMIDSRNVTRADIIGVIGGTI